MAKSTEAIINSKLLVWARNESGLTVDAAAKKVNVKPERLQAWEDGGLRPTVKQLRKLANAYKRPLAVFYLNEPPVGFAPLQDYRQLPGGLVDEESPELRFEIRRAYHRREIAIDLYKAIFDESPNLKIKVNLDAGSEILAGEIRKELGISFDDQISWRRRNQYEPLNKWRAALETAGVLVFQAEKVELDEMRGFSIGETPFPVIVLNIKDSPAGRVFTLLHELVHILLEDRGLCNLRGEQGLPPEKRKIEVLCNRVAGSVLVPRENLLSEEIVTGSGNQAEWSDDDLVRLANRYGVSREVILRRLLICGRTTKGFYESKREELHACDSGIRPDKNDKSWGPQPYRSAISRAGKSFVRLVLDNYYQDKITLSDVSEYLGVRLKHLRNIEAAVTG